MAIYGPPWREVEDARAVLYADGPLQHCCDQDVAVYSKRAGFFRVTGKSTARQLAEIIARHTGEPTAIYSGAIRTVSGRWLFPIQSDVVLSKAKDPTTRAGFAAIADELQRELRDYAREHEDAAVLEAMDSIEKDLGRLSEEGVVAALLVLVSGIIANIPASSRFKSHMLRILEQSSLATRIGASLSARERDIARRIGQDALAFVTDEYRRRSEAASEAARRIISQGLAQGLGRREIGGDLARALTDSVQGRTENYWRIVAAATTSRNRSFGQLAGYRAAGIVGYEWIALMDDRCCEVCRYLNGQIFPVDDALARFDRATRNQNPEEAINEFAWYRQVGGVTGEDGLRRGGDIYVSPRGQGPTELLATVERSGMGTNDDRGEHTTHRSVLSAGGTITPPAHGACRCTTVPVFG
jgi:SPP1 gp7 family putative phage head morphogenesis protein